MGNTCLCLYNFNYQGNICGTAFECMLFQTGWLDYSLHGVCLPNALMENDDNNCAMDILTCQVLPYVVFKVVSEKIQLSQKQDLKSQV